MSDFRNHFNETMKDETFQKEWKKLSAEREICHQIVKTRVEEGLTQQELALRCNMKPSNLSRLENGNANPSIETLLRIAAAMNRQLKISFV